MKKAYFFMNGTIFTDKNIDEKYLTEFILNDRYYYECENYGVKKSFDKCKKSSIEDINTTVSGYKNLLPNTYVAIYEIELNNDEYKMIDDDIDYVDFDMFDKIIKNKDKMMYIGAYDNNCNFVEHFLKDKELSYSSA